MKILFCFLFVVALYSNPDVGISHASDSPADSLKSHKQDTGIEHKIAVDTWWQVEIIKLHRHKEADTTVINTTGMIYDFKDDILRFLDFDKTVYSLPGFSKKRVIIKTR